MKLQDLRKKGVTLVISFFVIVILLILAAVFASRYIGEARVAEIQRKSTQAFAVAEGGLERALFELKKDFDNNPSAPSWADGDINGIACGPDTTNFYAFPLMATVLGNGSYTLALKNIAGRDNHIWVESTGTVENVSKTIRAYIAVDNFSCWNNAIFAGAGASGMAVNGNVAIRGSVHILGDGLTASDFAVDLSGSGNIGNNYEGIPQTLLDRIPPCPTVTFNGETVSSLDAYLRVKNGLTGLSGTALAGNPDVPGNSYKETLGGVFVSGGYAGNQGASNVYSDNGAQNSYDLGDAVTFPSLSKPYQGYSTYQDYLKDNSFVISDPAKLSELANMTPHSTFSYTDPAGKGSISMDGNGNLAISGVVYIDGGGLVMNEAGANKTVTYSGKGSIFSTGDVAINLNLLTQGAQSFPTNILGVMTPGSISFDAAAIEVMGMFYAEDTIIAKKQTSVAGSFVSNYFDMGGQVPSIYQVPQAASNLPPGMIANQPIWVTRIVSWEDQGT